MSNFLSTPSSRLPFSSPALISAISSNLLSSPPRSPTFFVSSSPSSSSSLLTPLALPGSGFYFGDACSRCIKARFSLSSQMGFHHRSSVDTRHPNRAWRNWKNICRGLSRCFFFFCSPSTCAQTLLGFFFFFDLRRFLRRLV